MNNQKVPFSEYSVTEDTEAVTENAAPVSNSMRRSAIFCEEFLNNLDNAESWNEILNEDCKTEEHKTLAEEPKTSPKKPRIKKYQIGFIKGQPCKKKTSAYLHAMIRQRSKSHSPSGLPPPIAASTSPNFPSSQCIENSPNLPTPEMSTLHSQNDYTCHVSYEQNWPQTMPNPPHYPEGIQLLNDFNSNSFYRRNQIYYDRTFSY